MAFVLVGRFRSNSNCCRLHHVRLTRTYRVVCTGNTASVGFAQSVKLSRNTATVGVSYSAHLRVSTNTTSNSLRALCLRSWLTVRTVSFNLTASSRRYECFSASFRIQHFYMTVNIPSEMLFNASRPTQPLLDCILLWQNILPSILPSSANQCILGNMYLRSNLSRKLCHSHANTTRNA